MDTTPNPRNLPAGTNLNIDQPARRVYPTNPKPIDDNGKLAAGCVDARQDWDMTRCFDPTCDRCWPKQL